MSCYFSSLTEKEVGCEPTFNLMLSLYDTGLIFLNFQMFPVRFALRKHLQRYHKLTEQHALMQVGSSLKNIEKSPSVERSPTVEISPDIETSLSVERSPTVETSREIDESSYIGRPCPTCDELYRVCDLEAHIAQCRASEPTSTTQEAPEPGTLNPSTNSGDPITQLEWSTLAHQLKGDRVG